MSTSSASKSAAGQHPHEVSFVAYPKFFFVWPLILLGFLFYVLAGWLNEDALEVLGWVYLVVLALVLMTLGVDVNRNQAIIWAVVIGALWIGGKYLEKVQGITILGDIYRWFNSLDVQYNRAFGLATSVVLLVPFAAMMVLSRLDSRWRITHNEFEHYAFGRMSDSLGRGAKTIRTDFPDVFELLFGLAGTLIVYNATGTKELRRIPHIMFLPMVRKKLNRILETTSITSAQMEEEEDDDDDV